jgi:4-azaleucine resistance transporter AzlC
MPPANAETATGRRRIDPEILEGARTGIPIGIASMLVGFSFGVAAEPVMGAAAAIAFSAIVYAGSAQFAATAVLAAGGSPVAAIAAGLMLNMRFLPMGVAVAPSMRGPAWLRVLLSWLMIDASWALANRGGGRFDVKTMLGVGLCNYPFWLTGTIVGALGSGVLGDPRTLGLDALFPAFFLALLVAEIRRPDAIPAAVLGAGIALALVPFTPPGIPILAASASALLALRRRP